MNILSFCRIVLSLALFTCLWASEIVFMDGRTMPGEVLSEDDTTIELALRDGRQTITMRMPKARVHAIRDGEDERIITARPTAAPRQPAARRRPEPEPEPEPEPGPRFMAFRGNHFGVFDDVQPPTRLAEDHGRVWSLPLSGGRSNASPVINGDLVFCMAEPHHLVAVDKRTGEERWRASNSLSDAGSNEEPHSPSWISTYGWTCPTPVTKGDWIWVALGNGVVAGYTTSGQRRWIHAVPVSGRHHGTSPSPCLIDDVLVTYTTSGSNGNYYGFNAISGQRLWSTRSAITQGSLVPITIGGRNYALSSGGVLIDHRNGNVVVQARDIFKHRDDDGHLGHNWGATVVVDGTIAYFSNHTADTTRTLMVAVDFANLQQPQIIWHSPTGDRIGASHIVHQGQIYLAGGRSLDAATGASIYEGMAGRANYSSLALAGGLLFQFGNREVTIWRPGRQYQELGRFRHGLNDFIASPVFDGRVIYFRDSHGLHCIGPLR